MGNIFSRKRIPVPSVLVSVGMKKKSATNQEVVGTATTASKEFVTNYESNIRDQISNQAIFEHYMPYEFPIAPVITSLTQTLVVESWKKIIATQYDDPDSLSGKSSGASYFYNQFFSQLFCRLRDFERIFPNIKARADIISHVMAILISVRVENLTFLKVRIASLGMKHVQIVHDPWQFGIYVTTIHSTIRLCLGDDATAEIMSAWLHLLSWVLRAMLPRYFGDYSRFTQYYEGAVNAAPAINDKVQVEIKNGSEVQSTRMALAKGLKAGGGGNSGFQSRGTGGLTANQRRQLEDQPIDEESTVSRSHRPHRLTVADTRKELTATDQSSPDVVQEEYEKFIDNHNASVPGTIGT